MLSVVNGASNKHYGRSSCSRATTYEEACPQGCVPCREACVLQLQRETTSPSNISIGAPGVTPWDLCLTDSWASIMEGETGVGAVHNSMGGRRRNPLYPFFIDWPQRRSLCIKDAGGDTGSHSDSTTEELLFRRVWRKKRRKKLSVKKRP